MRQSPEQLRPELVPGWIVDRVPGRDDISILVHPAAPRWALANETGVRLARLMDGTRGIRGVAEAFATDTGIAVGEELVADVMGFAAELGRSGLMRGVAGDSRREPKRPEPPSLTIYLTEECNLRCRHCAIVEGKMPRTKLDDDAIRLMIAEHAALHPGSKVTFLGGEPLLYPGCVDLLEEAARLGVGLSISTNGSLMTPAIAMRLAALPMKVQISLDGPDSASHDAIRGKGSFAKTMAAIGMMADAGAAANVVVATTLTRPVVGRIRELVGMMDQLGVGKVRFLPLTRKRAAETNWDSIHPDPCELAEAVWWATFESVHRQGAVAQVAGGFPGFAPDPPEGHHWCPLGETFIVDSQGETYVCPSLSTNDVNAGNALAEGLGRVELGARAKKAREWMLGRRHRNAECQACSWRSFCQGGCLAFMGHLSGSFEQNDEFCEFRRNMYRRFALGKAGIEWTPDDLTGPRAAGPIRKSGVN